MIKLRVLVTIATVFVSAATTAALAQDYYGGRTLRFGNTSGWYYDGRGDNRDFPTNGVFPGNFAADPANAAIGAGDTSLVKEASGRRDVDGMHQ
jgi:hypothetical protein